MNKRLFGTIALMFATVISMAQGAHSFKLNEVLVENTSGLVDEYGERSAWIEIANTSWGTNDIRSCYLTNDRRTLNKNLSVPERVKMMSLIPKGDIRTHLTAKQRIVFFADSMTNRGTLHLSFRLSPRKENFIALFDGNGSTLLDTLTVPASLSANSSYARVLNDEGKSVFIVLDQTKVSPGFPNVGESMKEDKIAEFKEKDPYGIGMSIMGMGLVFLSLILLYIFFRIFGRVMASLERLARLKSITAMRKQAHKAKVIAKHGFETKGIDKETYAAVIAMALYEYENDVHDVESGRITIVQHPTTWNTKTASLHKGGMRPKK